MDFISDIFLTPRERLPTNNQQPTTNNPSGDARSSKIAALSPVASVGKAVIRTAVSYVRKPTPNGKADPAVGKPKFRAVSPVTGARETLMSVLAPPRDLLAGSPTTNN